MIFFSSGLMQGIVDLEALHLTFAGKSHADEPGAGDTLDLKLIELGLHGLHLRLELGRLLHQPEESLPSHLSCSQASSWRDSAIRVDGVSGD